MEKKTLRKNIGKIKTWRVKKEMNIYLCMQTRQRCNRKTRNKSIRR